MTTTPAAEYCAAQTRTYDYERYFAAGFVPQDRRPALFAVYALNMELAQTRERVSEPLLGEIRLQWWRDAVDEIYDGRVREHQVATALAAAIGDYDLPRACLDGMIDARAFDLGDDPPEDLAALDAYADATAGNVFRAAMAVCGGPAAVDDGLCRTAGIAWALTGVLRSTPFFTAQRRAYLPLAALRRAGLPLESLFERTPPPALPEVVSTVAGRAGEALDEAAAAAGRLPPPVRAAFAYLAVARLALTRLRRAEHDVYSEAAAVGRLAAQIRILRAGISGRL